MHALRGIKIWGIGGQIWCTGNNRSFCARVRLRVPFRMSYRPWRRYYYGRETKQYITTVFHELYNIAIAFCRSIVRKMMDYLSSGYHEHNPVCLRIYSHNKVCVKFTIISVGAKTLVGTTYYYYNTRVCRRLILLW